MIQDQDVLTECTLEAEHIKFVGYLTIAYGRGVSHSDPSNAMDRYGYTGDSDNVNGANSIWPPALLRDKHVNIGIRIGDCTEAFHQIHTSCTLPDLVELGAEPGQKNYQALYNNYEYFKQNLGKRVPVYMVMQDLETGRDLL